MKQFPKINDLICRHNELLFVIDTGFHGNFGQHMIVCDTKMNIHKVIHLDRCYKECFCSSIISRGAIKNEKI